MPPDIFNTVHRDRIITLAAQYRLPVIYPYRYYVANDGLLSYGVDPSDLYRRAASYVDRIPRGAQPADLPVAVKVRAGDQHEDRQGARPRRAAIAARPRRRGDRMRSTLKERNRLIKEQMGQRNENRARMAI